MSLVEADEVPDARSFCSTSITRRPRPAASRAIATPLMPPPTIARSKSAMLIPPGGRMTQSASSRPYESRGGRMDFQDRHVVVTGGTGALGIAVVGALVEA